MPYVPNSTWVDGPGGGTPVSAARLNNMEAGISPAYLTYTPTWTGATAPVINNGSLAGRYVQIGKLVVVKITLVIGSTTTMGTGNYQLSLPVTAQSSTTYQPWGVMTLLDFSAGQLHTGVAVCSGVATTVTAYTSGSPANPWGAGIPVALATSDVIQIGVTYEAA